MGAVSKNDFNYESVDPETAQKLEYYARSGKALIRKSQVQFIAEMGRILSEARHLLGNKKNGTFLKWAAAEFDWSTRTIWNYVNAWEKIMCNNCTLYLGWSATALYLAAAEEVPETQLKTLNSKEIVRACDVQKVIGDKKKRSKKKAAQVIQEAKEEQAPKEESVDDAVPFGEDPKGGVSQNATNSTEQSSTESSSGQKSDEQWKHLRTVAIKHIEALQRTLGDLNSVRPIRFLETSLDDCREMIVNLRGMK